MLVISEKDYMVAALYKNNILQTKNNYYNPLTVTIHYKNNFTLYFNKKNTDAKCLEKITLA
jgi:hypothetical protein